MKYCKWVCMVTLNRILGYDPVHWETKPRGMQASIFGACHKTGWIGRLATGMASSVKMGVMEVGCWLVRMEWHLAGLSVCLHHVIFPCTIKPRRRFLLAPSHPGGPGKSCKTVVYVCVWSFTLGVLIFATVCKVKGNSRQVFQIVKSMTWKFQLRLQCIQSATDKNLTEAAQIAHNGQGILQTCTTMRKGMELNKNIGSKSLHHFVQGLLVRSVRQQVAKPQVLMMSQLNCSKQEERQHWTECTEYVWRSGKLVSGQRTGHSPHSSHFPRKVMLKSVKTTEQLLWFPMQARYFSASYWKGSKWRLKQKLQTSRWDSDKVGWLETRWRI